MGRIGSGRRSLAGTLSLYGLSLAGDTRECDDDTPRPTVDPAEGVAGTDVCVLTPDGLGRMVEDDPDRRFVIAYVNAPSREVRLQMAAMALGGTQEAYDEARALDEAESDAYDAFEDTLARGDMPDHALRVSILENDYQQMTLMELVGHIMAERRVVSGLARAMRDAANPFAELHADEDGNIYVMGPDGIARPKDPDHLAWAYIDDPSAAGIVMLAWLRHVDVAAMPKPPSPETVRTDGRRATPTPDWFEDVTIATPDIASPDMAPPDMATPEPSDESLAESPATQATS
jgi:hypothetical protein